MKVWLQLFLDVVQCRLYSCFWGCYSSALQITKFSLQTSILTWLVTRPTKQAKTKTNLLWTSLLSFAFLFCLILILLIQVLVSFRSSQHYILVNFVNCYLESKNYFRTYVQDTFLALIPTAFSERRAQWEGWREGREKIWTCLPCDIWT